MKAGKYYVGDLFHVMYPNWDEMCKLKFPGDEQYEGEITLSNGVMFASFSSDYCEGAFGDGNGNSYSVTAGSIGCVLLSDISDPDADLSLGAVIDFPEDFEVSSDGQTLVFGHISIDTGKPNKIDMDEYEY